MDRILERFGEELECCLISQESHQDGNQHLHLYIQFKNTKNFKNPAVFDFIANKHPNIQKTRSTKRWVKYCIKEDTEFLAHGWSKEAFILYAQAKSAPVWGKIETEIQAGMSLGHILTNYPQMYGQIAKLSTMHSIVKSLNVNVKLEIPSGPWDQWIRERLPCSGNGMFAPYVPIGAPALWISGPAGCGKSTLTTLFSLKWKTVKLDGSGNWFDGFIPDLYELGVVDEINPGTELTKRNLQCATDGHENRFRIKGGTVMGRLPPLVFTSNFDPIDIWPCEGEAARALSRRFVNIRVEASDMVLVREALDQELRKRHAERMERLLKDLDEMNPPARAADES
jgi:hypothetical protein